MRDSLFSFWVLCLFYVLPVASQTTASPQKLDTVVITSSRIISTSQAIPAAVSVYKATEEAVSKQQLTLRENLQEIPGVFSQNATNFAQDLRISIRGFGARSAFGIRGIKLLVDLSLIHI